MSRYSGADRRTRPLGSDHGFTLMETMVALVIFVACYLLIHQGLSLGWRGVRLAQSETAALQAFWVTVAVNWRDKWARSPRSVQLTTMKLVAQP